MIEATALWANDDRFVGQASSGHALVVDTGAEKSANSPVELVLIALCACTASDVVGILRKKREPFTSLEVRATGERAETFPKVFTSIRLTYRVGGNVTPQSNGRCGALVERKVLLCVGDAGEDGEDRGRD